MFDTWRLLPGVEEPDETDHVVLRWVSVLHVLTTGQVARSCLADDRSPVAARRAAQRRLARLHRLGLLERLEHRGGASTELAWRLTSTGMQVADPGTPAWRRREPSLSRLAHVHEVAELVVRLHEAARSGASEVTEVQGEPACWRPTPSARTDTGDG